MAKDFRPDELDLTQFLTPALRSWLVNDLLPDSLASEMHYALLELGYTDLPPPEVAAIRDFLKREMSQLAARQGGACQADRQTHLYAQAQLIRLCESIVQFYLLQHPTETPLLEHLNQLLPPGLSFSLVSGRLIFEPELYFQSHNLYYQEQPFLSKHFEAVGAEERSPSSEALTQPVPASVGQAAALPEDRVESLSGSQPDAAPSLAEDIPRHQRFRQIRARRLQLLKEWES